MEKNKIKKLLITLLCIPMLVFGQKTYVPDDVFEAWLEGNGYGDGIAFNDSVATDNISSINDLIIENKGIADLTGIEDFTNLAYLSVYGNNLTTLDLRFNYNLWYIGVENNPLLSQLIFPDSSFYNLIVNNGTYVNGIKYAFLSNCNFHKLNIINRLYIII